MAEINVAELGFELAHVGINNVDDAAAKATAQVLCDLFGFACRETAGSYFIGNNEFEIMKKNYLGELGHVAIRTNDIEKAMAYLEGKGIGFDASSAARDDAGSLRAIYFDKDIAGFRFHLAQK